jgi:hypothetical protein
LISIFFLGFLRARPSTRPAYISIFFLGFLNLTGGAGVEEAFLLKGQFFSEFAKKSKKAEKAEKPKKRGRAAALTRGSIFIRN